MLAPRVGRDTNVIGDMRRESTTGLKKKSSTKQQYSSKCRSRLPATSRSQPTFVQPLATHFVHPRKHRQ